MSVANYWTRSAPKTQSESADLRHLQVVTGRITDENGSTRIVELPQRYAHDACTLNFSGNDPVPWTAVIETYRVPKDGLTCRRCIELYIATTRRRLAAVRP